VSSKVPEPARPADFSAAVGQDSTDRERLERALIEANARAVHLHALTSALSGALTRIQVIEVILRHSLPLLGAAAAVAYFVDGEGSALELVDSAGVEPERLRRYTSIPVTEPLPACRAFWTGQPVWVETREQLHREFPEYAASFERVERQAQAIACLPMLVRGRATGVFVFGFRGERVFSEQERAAIMGLVEQSTQALERTQLHESERKARARIETLARVSDALAQAKLDLPSLLRVITDEIATTLGDACEISLLSEDGEFLHRPAWRLNDPEADAFYGELIASEGLPWDEGFTGRIVKTGLPLLVPVLSPEHLQASSTRARRFLERYPFYSIMGVPLRAEGRMLGVIMAARCTLGRSYVAEDLGLLEAIAQRASWAIANAHQHEALRAARAEAEAQRESLHRAAAEREKVLRELEVERQRLAAVLREAEAAGRAKDEFLAMLGHELRNPLAPILTALQLMQMRGGEAFLRERAVIERQVRHFVRLVDDLLDVSRITRGKIELKRRPLELSEVVAKAVEMVSPLLEEREHRLSVAVPPGFVVEADEHRLAQIVSNLLTNSAKYTEPGGHIEVSAGAEQGGVGLRVRDSGVGIGPELLPQVFEPFIQSARTLDRAQGGLGLGLTIVRNLVRLHGGHVQVESEGPMKGSTFTVWLPLFRRELGELRKEEAPLVPAANTLRSGARRILLVDDNRDAADALAEALEEFGHGVTVAYDGPGGLEAAARQPPDLGLLDIGLPVMDGYELARRLRELPGMSAVPLVAVTGYGQESDRRRALEAGFQEHVVKPVDLAQLRSLLERLLGSEAEGSAG
jgi:signal transduction histidine kinase/ActR/RegA family two-component response regulator